MCNNSSTYVFVLSFVAKVGNGIMCRALLQLGANPIIKNLAKRTAATEARENRFLYLAEWLSKKVSM